MRKHGITFERAMEFEADTAVVKRIDHVDGEERTVMFGLIGSKIRVLAFTEAAISYG